MRWRTVCMKYVLVPFAVSKLHVTIKIFSELTWPRNAKPYTKKNAYIEFGTSRISKKANRGVCMHWRASCVKVRTRAFGNIPQKILKMNSRMSAK